MADHTLTISFDVNQDAELARMLTETGLSEAEMFQQTATNIMANRERSRFEEWWQGLTLDQKRTQYLNANP